MVSKKLNYILITPAKNEAEYLHYTAESIINQTVKPLHWIIIDDGSTDKTGCIAEKYRNKYSFIDIVSKPIEARRSFASKAIAFNDAYNSLSSLTFDFIGNLDADVTLPNNYYEILLNRIAFKPELGMAGGVIVEKVNNKIRLSSSGLNHVAGAFQLFRRNCFEQIGGYKPVCAGGMDSIALITARMYGWQTRMYRDLEVIHHRPAGRYIKTALRVAFTQGKTDYNLGLPTLFAVAKFLKRIPEYPFLIASTYRLAGFINDRIFSKKRDVGDEFVYYYRKELLARVKKTKKKRIAL